MAEGDDLKITLGGKEWPIPELPWGVTKKLMPLMSKCAHIDPNNVTDEKMEAIGSVMLLAIKAGTPDMTAEKFDAMPVKLIEMLRAIPIILKAADLKTVETKPGEAPVQQPAGQTS